MLYLRASNWIYIFSMVIMFITSTVTANDSNAGTGPTVITKSSNETVATDYEFPTETQNAQCTIKAGNIEASAQASVSKKLEGICGTKQMKISFEILETRLMHEIYQLKAMINLLQPNYAQHYQYNSYTQGSPQQQYFRQSSYPVNMNHYEQTTSGAQNHNLPFQISIPQIQNPTSVTNQIKTTPVTNKETALPPYTMVPLSTVSSNTGKSKVIKANEIKATTASSITEKILEFKPVQMKSLNRFKSKHNKLGPRDFEVHKFNNTLLAGGEIRIFTYYWRLENFTVKLKSNASFILSPIFSISGLNLRVKATLNHLNRDYLYLQLESVQSNLAENVSSNIILETGDLFKEIETKKFFRHKIVILDQGTPTSDLISQEFLNTQSGFPVPNSAIKSPPYAKNDSILIKIVIFL